MNEPESCSDKESLRASETYKFSHLRTEAIAAAGMFYLLNIYGGEFRPELGFL